MPSETFSRLVRRLDGWTGEMIEFQRDLTATPALGPKNGGEGEAARAALIRRRLAAWGLTDVETIDAPDPAVPAGVRPNLILRLAGESAHSTLWIMAHTDVVPPGDPALWDGDPWTLREEDGKLIGRGVEDNQQGLVGALFAARALQAEGIRPARGLAVLLCADEETGSHHGLDYVLARHPEYVGAEDLIVVPDVGQPDSRMIEVAEKSILWLKITVHGRQCHASMPQDGVNAARAAAALTLRLEELYSRFPDEAADFVPPRSTFEPTRREANVPNVNTLPGQDVFYLDCRILPHYAVAAVRAAVREAADAVAAERGVTIDVEDEMCLEAGPATPAEAPVVRALQAAVREVYGVAAVPMGIGGGTVAACFRRRGLPAAVWCTIDQMAHQPNESCRVSNLVNDAKVFAHLALQPPEA